jgi:ribosomal-protein-serine acetyltransferase
MLNVPEELTSARLTLRSFGDRDSQALWEAIEESRQQLDAWQRWQRVDAALADVESRIRRIQDAFAARTQLYYAVLSKGDDRFLGWVGLEHIDWRIPAFQIGYWIRASATGHGFATEAAGLLVALALDRLHAKRVAIWVDSRNERSIAVARRLGFQQEGRLQNERLDAAGMPQTTLVLAKIASVPA